MPDKQSKTESPAAVSSTPMVRRTSGRPTGYLIWDSGKLMQQFEYEERTWFGEYWHATLQTEWREVPRKTAPNTQAER